MKTDHLLNTLILSLSVSTVIITLLSYLIYKIRQFPKSGGQAQVAKKKEGVFFRRYVPAGSITALAGDVPDKVGKFSQFNTLPFYFGMILAIVFSSLFFKDYFSDKYSHLVRKYEIRRLKTLKQQGLLQSYELDNSAEPEAFEEVIPENLKRLTKQKVELLKTKSIALIKWSNNQKYNSTHAGRSFEGWVTFLKSHGLNYQVVTDQTSNTHDLYILPQMKSLSGAQQSFIDKLSLEGKGLLLTGYCGTLDGTGVQVDVSFCEKKFDLKFIRKGLNHKSKPSLFAAGPTPGWSIPPGFLTDWYPEDEEYSAVSSKGEGEIFEAKFSGKFSTENKIKVVRGLHKENAGSKQAWLTLEPHGLFGKNANHITYGESALIDSLIWLSNIPQVQIADWKDGKKWAFAVSIDSEDKIEGAHTLWSILSNLQIPGTFFVVSDQLKNDARLIKIKSPILELGSHSKDHSIMTKLDLDEQFYNIQESRLTLEEKSEHLLAGFHPPEERFDNATISAIAQNKFSYFPGDQRVFRLAPLFINYDLLYIPRVLTDDVLLKRNRQLISNEDNIEVLMSDSNRAKFLGGLQYFNAHSQIMGQGFYSEVFEEYLTQLKSKDDLWMAGLGEINKWWRQKRSLEITLANDGLTLHNSSAEEVYGVVLYINGKARSPVKLKPDQKVIIKY